MGVSQIRGTLFRVPYNKDYSILGSTLGSPHLGKLPYNPPDTIIFLVGTAKKVPPTSGNANSISGCRVCLGAVIEN